MPDTAIAPAAPQAAPTTQVGTVEALREAFLKHGLSSVEKSGFEVRQGIWFDGIEVFLNGKIYTVEHSRVESARDKGTLDVLAGGVLRTLRQRQLIFKGRPQYEPLYTRQEVASEICHALLTLASEILDDQAVKKVLWDVRQSVGIDLKDDHKDDKVEVVGLAVKGSARNVDIYRRRLMKTLVKALKRPVVANGK